MSATRAVLYARVSTDTGQQDTETQLRALRDLCRVRGYVIASEHIDRISGDPGRRRGDPPGLRAALDQLSRRRASILVIFAADRLVRSAVGLLELVGRVHDLQARIVSLQDGSDLDTSTDTGQLVTFLKGWFARMSLNLTRTRTVAGLARARANGKTLGRPRAPEPCPAAVWRYRHSGEMSIARKISSTRHRVRIVLARLRAHYETHGVPWPPAENHELVNCRLCPARSNNGGSESAPLSEENGGADRHG